MSNTDKGAVVQPHYDPKPIPIRTFDWTAFREGYEPGDPLGHGKTASEAIADLYEREAP